MVESLSQSPEIIDKIDKIKPPPGLVVKPGHLMPFGFLNVDEKPARRI